MQLLVFLFGLLAFTPNANAQAGGAATAVRALGVTSAGLPCEKLEQELNSKSYFQAVCIKQKISPGKGAKYYRAAGKKYKVDALLIVDEIEADKSVQLIHVESGKSIATFTGTDIANVESLTTAILSAFPYRGFVTSVRDEQVEINLGTRHGLKPGTFLSLFEIGSGTLSGPQKPLGVAQVTVVSEASSSAKIVDSEGRIARFAKIAHEDAATPKASALVSNAIARKAWFAVGSELRTIRTTAKGGTGSRAYTMNVTPFVSLAAGRDKWDVEVLYGYASDQTESLSYLSINGAYMLRSSGTFKSGTTIALGAWLSQYNATAKQGTTGLLEDFSRYAPYIEARYQRVIKDKVVVGLTGEIAYPILASAQGAGPKFQSYSVAAVPSIRVRTSDWLSAEAGFRIQQIAVALDGGLGTTETHSGPFLRAIILF